MYGNILCNKMGHYEPLGTKDNWIVKLGHKLGRGRERTWVSGCDQNKENCLRMVAASQFEYESKNILEQ